LTHIKKFHRIRFVLICPEHGQIPDATSIIIQGEYHAFFLHCSHRRHLSSRQLCGNGVCHGQTDVPSEQQKKHMKKNGECATVEKKDKPRIT